MKLKCCPVCGNKNVNNDEVFGYSFRGYGLMGFVECRGCGFEITVIGSKENAATTWNLIKLNEKEDEKQMSETKQKTMIEDFFEKFPDAPRNGKGDPLICPEEIYNVETHKDCDYLRPYDTSCRACWSRPVPPRRECYKNATVIVEYDQNGEPNISWVRQEDTERIGYEEAMKRVMKVKAVDEG